MLRENKKRARWDKTKEKDKHRKKERVKGGIFLKIKNKAANIVDKNHVL